MNTGKTIKLLREKQEITLQELASDTGIGIHSLRSLEEGNYVRISVLPIKEALEKIAEHLGVTSEMVHLLSVEIDDVPEEKKKLFKDFYPMVRMMAIELISKGDDVDLDGITKDMNKFTE